MPVPQPLPGEVSVRQAKAISGYSEITLRREINAGRLTARRSANNGPWFIRLADLGEWLGVPLIEIDVP